MDWDVSTVKFEQILLGLKMKRIKCRYSEIIC